MKKYLWIFFILIIGVGIAIFAFNNNNNQEETYTAKRTGSNINENNVKEGIENITKQLPQYDESTTKEPIAEFTTRLPNDTEARDGNIRLACEKLSGTVVKAKEEFSLWDTIGCPSKETGYEKAKSFTSDGDIIQSYGGGICQLSTTIYNAVLKVQGLKITERHEHSREVPYIQDGKDAAVSYGNSDLKFKNTLDYDVKIEAKVENREVKITLVRI